jgi:hypothetical protein
VGAARWVEAGARGVRPLAVLPGPWRRDGDRLLLPYVEGPTLQEVLQHRDHHPLAPKTARRIAKALGRQMARAHAAGLCNRDHKPTNVVLDAAALAGEAPCLIDLEGVERRPVGDSDLLTMVSSLWRVVRRSDLVATEPERRAFLAGLLGDRRPEERRGLLNALGEVTPAPRGRGAPRAS